MTIGTQFNDHDDAEEHIIISYTRKQALEDGEQIDVTELAREAGFRIPVFMTRGVWHHYVQVPEGVRHQDEAGRLWDIVKMLYFAIRHFKKMDERSPRMEFSLLVRNRNDCSHQVTLAAEAGPVDIEDPRPSITIMLEDED